eukprot:748920-Hanusia_phi.AAC.1
MLITGVQGRNEVPVRLYLIFNTRIVPFETILCFVCCTERSCSYLLVDCISRDRPMSFLKGLEWSFEKKEVVAGH